MVECKEACLMGPQRGVRGTKAVVVFAALFAASTLLPAAASAQGNLVDDLLGGVLSEGGSGGSPDPRAGAPPNYTPPLHGSNPHGQGSVAVIDLTPSNTLPLPGDPAAGDEEVTVGDSRGEDNGTYHGRVYLLHAKVLGFDSSTVLPPMETNEGESETGFVPGLQTVLDAICTGVPPAGLGQAAGCVTLASANSSTTPSGSQNSFSLASTNLNIGGVGLTTDTASSSGSISDNGTCQTANGSSGVEDASVGLPGLPAITASALQGSSTSQACNNGTQSQSNSSSVLTIMGTGLGLPATGCANGTPDTNFTPLAPLIGIVCNADDSNSGQAGAPYGVREALTVFALVIAGDPLLKVTTAGPESRAVAPPATPAGPGAPGADDQPGGGPGGEEDRGGPGGPAATTAQAGGELAFTGANLLVLALIGGALMVGGVMLARASARGHSRATT
jgi:hypothetical protein